MKSIPFFRADFTADEETAVCEVLRSGWLTSGPQAAAFEKEVAAYCDAPHALAANSGTAALHLALAGLGLGPGDQVITTPLTFCATVNTILHVGATPVMADIDSTLNISPAAIEAKLTERTKAVMPVHYAGLPCDMDAIWAIAERHGLFVVEDAAHAIGSGYRGRKIGSGASDAVCFSFYANKNVPCGEGGMVLSRSRDLSEKMRVLCLHGIDKDAWGRYGAKGRWHYRVTEAGFKDNMPDMSAAVGRVQLRKIAENSTKRAAIAARYDAAFADLHELEVPPRREDSEHCWHLYAIRLRLDDLTIDRATFIEAMADLGVQCSVHFIPVPMHPYYEERFQWAGQVPLAMEEYPRLVSLPLFPSMTDSEVDQVTAAVRETISKNRVRQVVAV
jgi:dTDP-4-amino-4,6-dideoxygalactose transaminase